MFLKETDPLAILFWELVPQVGYGWAHQRRPFVTSIKVIMAGVNLSFLKPQSEATREIKTSKGRVDTGLWTQGGKMPNRHISVRRMVASCSRPSALMSSALKRARVH